MKKRHLTKTVTAALAAATLVSSVAIAQPPVKASAAGSFVTEVRRNGDTTIDFDESQIKVEIQDYINSGIGVSTYLESNTIKSLWTKVPALDRRTITIDVSASGNTNTVKSQLKKIIIHTLFTMNNKPDDGNDYAPTSVEYDNRQKCYHLNYDIIAFGDYIRFDSTNASKSVISSISNFKVVSTTMTKTPEQIQHTLVKVTTPNNYDDLVIRLRKDKTISSAIWKSNVTNWAKNVCMSANALSIMTGVKHGVLRIDYDRDCGYRLTKDWYIQCNDDATTFDLDHMREKNNELTWGLIHEISHSYAVGLENMRGESYDCNFRKNYYFSRYTNDAYDETDTMEEFMVNPRMLTALQNCDDLRNIKLYNDNKNYWDTENSIISETCMNIMNHFIGSDLRMQFTKKTAAMASENNGAGWQQLEKFFAANDTTLVPVYMNSNEKVPIYSYESADSYKAAKALATVLDQNYGSEYLGHLSDPDQDFIQFANAFRMIYWYTQKPTSFNGRSYWNFIDANYDLLYVLEVANYLRMYDVNASR